MSTPNINCILQAVLAVQNNQISPPPQITTIDLGNPTLGGNQAFYEQFLQAPTTGAGQGMPGPSGIAYAVIVQNLSPTANMTIAITPNAGVLSTVTVGPQGLYIYFDPAKQGGITAITIAGVGSTVPALIWVAN